MISLQSRLMLVIGFMVCVCLFVSIGVTDLITKSLLSDSLYKQYEKDLIGKRELAKEEITTYFSFIENQIKTMSADISVIEAAEQFKDAFQRYPEQRIFNKSTETASVKRYYTDFFNQEYKNHNQGNNDATKMYNGLADYTMMMQYDYISNNSNPLGKKDALSELNNQTDYDNVHQHYHSSFRNFLTSFEYYDIFIVDAQTGDIVYSVYKELDFATNLFNGPYADTGIGKAFKEALDLTKDQSFLTDFSPYLPSYNNAASFISSPIYQNNELSAVLIFQMPISRINNIMTHDSKWQTKGFGDSGETYLVGSDFTLRNESRFFVEDKPAYLKLLKTFDLQTANNIETRDTSIALMQVETVGVKAALDGNTGFDIFKDYRGVHVLSAYSPVKVGNLTWAIMSEVDDEEAFRAVDLITDKLLYYGVLVFVSMFVLALGLSYFVARALTKPLRKIGYHFNELSHGDADLTIHIEQTKVPEINTIVDGFNKFVSQLHHIVAQVKGNAEQLSVASAQLNTMSHNSNQIATEQNNETEQVKSALAQFTDAITEVAENSVFAASQTSLANENISVNNDKANQARSSIADLVDEVKQSANIITSLQQEVINIKDVLLVIDSIADQTNLLALNAAIEAARAGEHGRGFAVVADEVRTLAAKTQESTVEIQQKIEQLTDVANTAVKSMDQASSSANNGIVFVEEVSSSLVTLGDNINDLVRVNETVASANEEQKYTCDTINTNVNRVSNSAIKLYEVSDEVSQATTSLLGVAEQLSQGVSRFKV